jgi:hypothetical protein
MKTAKIILPYFIHPTRFLVMKCIELPIEEKLPLGDIYLDELLEVEKILKEKKPESFYIASIDLQSTYAIESFEEIDEEFLTKVGEETNLLIIQTRKPDIRITLLSSLTDNGIIRAEEPSDDIRGLLGRLKKVLTTNPNDLKYKILPKYFFSGPWIFTFVLVSIMIWGILYSISTPKILVTFFCVFVIYQVARSSFLKSCNIKNGPRKFIYFKRKKDRTPSFWERNKDDLIKGVLFTLFGAACTILSGWFCTNQECRPEVNKQETKAPIEQSIQESPNKDSSKEKDRASEGKTPVSN